MFVIFFFWLVIYGFIGSKYSIPEIDEDAKIMVPHFVFVVGKMHGFGKPEAQARIIMLKLVCVGGQGAIDYCAGRERHRRYG